MGEIKQTNFRIDTDTAEVFRKFCEENGFNQAQGFDHIIQVMELNRAKTEIPDRLTEITTFEEYVKKVMESYLNSLQIAQNTEERVREEFRRDIELRDKALEDAEIKIGTRDRRIENLMEEAKELRKTSDQAVKEAENCREQAAASAQIAQEKEKINSMLTTKLAEAEEKLQDYVRIKSMEGELNKKISDQIHEYDMLVERMENEKGKAADLAEKVKASEERNEKIKEENNGLKVQVQTLKNQFEAQEQAFKNQFEAQAREAERERNIAIERAVIEAERKNLDNIEEIKAENIRLKAQIEMIREQMKAQQSAQEDKKKNNL